MATNQSHNTSEMLLEGLTKGLKAAWRFVKVIIRILGILIIDKGMRSVVLWYDKTQGNKVNIIQRPDRKQEEEIKNLRNQLKAAKEQAEETQTQNGLLKTELVKSKNKVEELSLETRGLSNGINQLKQQIEGYKTQLSGLEEEKNELMKHAVSPQLIPSTILYAEGDASSPNLRKTNVRRQSTTLYEIHTEPGNYSEGIYYALTPNNVNQIVENRSVALRACRIDYVEPNANAIMTITPGRVRKNGSEWESLEPAVIKLVKQ